MASLGFRFLNNARPGATFASARASLASAAQNSAAYKALDMTVKGNLIAVPLIAFSAAGAPRGERVSRLAAEVSGVAVYPAMAAAISLFIPGGPLLGAGARAIIATLAAAIPNMYFVENANRAFSKISRAEQRIMRIETGGNYQDSATAQAFRFNSLNEMSSAFQSSRTWLGREAFMLR